MPKGIRENIIAQAAEAIIVLKEVDCQGTLVPCIVKRRIKKSYRIPEIDEKLRKQRTKKESKLIGNASSLISVPKIIKTDESGKEITMQFVDGKKLSDWLEQVTPQRESPQSLRGASQQERKLAAQKFGIEKARHICQQIGESIAKLHDADIIHGDLTTSNMILNEKDNKVYFIDFGLGFISSRIEDKAVDLHLLRQALEAKHFQHWKILFDSVIEGYNKSKNADKTLLQLEKVEKRGRYKH